MTKNSQVSEMKVFVRSVERQSFSAVARELGLTPSAVSKLVSRLEARLAVRLLTRSTRYIAATPEGQAFYERCRHILEEIEEAEDEVARFRAQPRGLLRISVGVAFGLRELVPALPRFLGRYPEIQIELLISDRHFDMTEEGCDMAIRLGPITESSLIARKICNLERLICASPAYLSANGTPQSPDELAQHNCLSLLGVPDLQRWPFITKTGKRIIDVKGTVAMDNASALLLLALDGVGIVRLTDMLVGTSIRMGTLVPILKKFHNTEPLPFYVVYPHARHRAARVIAMVDFLMESFAHAPWRVIQEISGETPKDRESANSEIASK